MELQEIRDKLTKLEREIFNQIVEFQKETGTSIEEINLVFIPCTPYTGMYYDDTNNKTLIAVKTKILL